MASIREPGDGVAKLAMRAFLGLLVVNALVAIAAILGATGSAEWKVVGTTLLLTAGCLTIAANAAALERDRLLQLPYVGAGFSCVAFAVFILLVWIGPGSDSDAILKTTFILLTLGLAATYASVLAIPDLDGVFVTARRVGYATVALIAGLTVAVTIAEGGVSAQVFAVFSVVLATATIIVVTGAIIESRKLRPSERVADDAHLGRLHCPVCRSPFDASGMSVSQTCNTCGLAFRIEILSPPDR